MENHEVFFKLRDVLAELYVDQESARIIIIEAGLDERNITFSDRAQANWFAILTEAVKTDQASNLLRKVADSTYGNYPPFRDIYDEYSRLVNNGTRLMFPRIRGADNILPDKKEIPSDNIPTVQKKIERNEAPTMDSLNWQGGTQANSLNMAILRIKDLIVNNFGESDWQNIALITDSYDLINNHPRLLRSLSFGDDDYEGNVAQVLRSIFENDPNNLQIIDDYIDRKFSDESIYISEKPSSKRITFAPQAFNVPDVEIRNDLVAVMMPFAGFDAVYAAIKNACSAARLECLRADDIWKESTFIQDIVNLIFQARIVVCDFSDRNPNVFYETGIAHTLGKEVVPISQSLNDIPSDLRHHRALPYLGNTQGLEQLRDELATRLQTIVGRI